MMRVTLRQLQVFEAVARLKSFSSAAEELQVSQPTVSKQIKQMQEEIGLPLFEQIGKKVFLTEAGTELYTTSADWLETWGRFEQTVANLKGMQQGKLKIAAVTTTKYFMPRILGPFCAEYPHVDISMEVVNRDRLLERLHHNQDDMYIMGVPPDELDVEAEPFLDNPIVVLAPASHPLAKRKRIPFKALGKESFLMREHGSGTRMTIEKLFQEHETPLNVKMELGSNEAIKQAVAGGLGLALLSESTLKLDPSQDELTTLNVQGFPLMRAWYVVRPKGKSLSVAAQTFLQFLRDHVQLLVPHV
jgi:DNA-binding transcriptional LysR family regulator